MVASGALGLALSVVATRLLGGLLFESDALDPPTTFLGMPLVLGVAALLAAYVAAHRASRVNPVAAPRIDRAPGHPTSPGRQGTIRPPFASNLSPRCARQVRMLAAEVSSVRIVLKTRRLFCWHSAF